MTTADEIKTKKIEILNAKTNMVTLQADLTKLQLRQQLEALNASQPETPPTE